MIVGWNKKRFHRCSTRLAIIKIKTATTTGVDIIMRA